MDKTIRFGVVGLGLMGREFASALARWCSLMEFPVRAELVAACASSAKSLEWARRNFPGLRQATTDYRELVSCHC